MSDTQSVDPRRARTQPAATAPAEPEQPQASTETSTEQVRTTEEPAQASAGGDDSPDQTIQPQPEAASESVVEPQVERDPSAEAVPEQPSVAEAQESAPSTDPSSSALDAAISATLGSIVSQEPPRDSTSTPALYEADPASAEVPKVDTPTLPAATASSSKPAPSKPASSLSRVAQLTQRVEKDPLDGEAQLALLQEVESKGDLERTREVYEKFLTTFPDAVSLHQPQRVHARGRSRARHEPDD